MNERFEELAALEAMGLLTPEEQEEFDRLAEEHPELLERVRESQEAFAWLAAAVPQVEPPPEARERLFQQLSASKESRRIISFPEWVPYALAACLMALAVFQAGQIFVLKHRLAGQRAHLAEVQSRSHLAGLRLASLDAKDASYAAARILVAWDTQARRGLVSIQNMPPPPAGKDYQLWVLDPTKAAPVSAGLLAAKTVQRFASVQPVSSTGLGFAISLEPGGGSPAPTGAILFAVAPGA